MTDASKLDQSPERGPNGGPEQNHAIELPDVIRALRLHVESSVSFGVDRLPAPKLPKPPPAQPEPPPPTPRATPSARPNSRPASAPQPKEVDPASSESELPPRPSSDAPLETRSEYLETLRERVAACTACRLHKGRNKSVFADGPTEAQLMFVGEGPGADEDRKGLPFVGKAGQLLDRIIAAMGLRREDVYIANVVKCRPPQNRTPQPDEAARCLPYLDAQIAMVQPKVIGALGSPAFHALVDTKLSITRARGKIYRRGDIRVIPTFHPAYLLRTPSAKKLVWEDVQVMMRWLAKED